MAKPKTLKTCSFCAREVYKLANPSRGLCAACYYREKKNGELAYKPVRVRSICSVEGCEGEVVGGGMCQTHYRRMRRHGVAEHERFDKWGHANKHPLANTYYHMRRTYPDEVCSEWIDDFWAFVRDIGERPSQRHKFKRIDTMSAYSKTNFFWDSSDIETSSEGRVKAAEYARIYRAANPDLYRDKHLSKKYGITLSQYKEMEASQNGVCAICGKPETANHHKTGLPRGFAVDHCHDTGIVRALLCSKCNTGLGSFRDSPYLMRVAAAYVEKHALRASDP